MSNDVVRKLFYCMRQDIEKEKLSLCGFFTRPAEHKLLHEYEGVCALRRNSRSSLRSGGNGDRSIQEEQAISL